MKFLLVCMLTVTSLHAFADHHKDKDWKKKWDFMSFEDAKKHKTQMLAEKKAGIEKTQACVDKTTDKKGIEACMDEMHQAMKMKKEEMMKKKK